MNIKILLIKIMMSYSEILMVKNSFKHRGSGTKKILFARSISVINSTKLAKRLLWKTFDPNITFTTSIWNRDVTVHISGWVKFIMQKSILFINAKPIFAKALE